MTLDLLCKVVDNYGDIGLVYRLAKALTDLDPGLHLRLHVDDLAAFQALCPAVDPAREVQELRGWTLVRWNADWPGLREEPPRFVLECFACGRPERFEEILFDPADPVTRHIVNLEHLTAEPWAEELHRMPSATRSGLVKKSIFMPGFTPKTGGLIIDRSFRETLERWRGQSPAAAPRTGTVTRAAARRALAARAGLALHAGGEDRLWIPVFSYEHDFRRIVAALAARNGDGPLLVLVAAGRSAAPFLAAWEAAGSPFPALALPFLPQETLDEFLMAADFSIVRGEESLARAALTGKPFLWHAYLQDGKHQLVKVRALLERLRPHLAPEDYAPLEALWLAFNDRAGDSHEAGGDEPLLPVLERLDSLASGYAAFAAGLLANGDLATHLLTYIREIV